MASSFSSSLMVSSSSSLPRTWRYRVFTSFHGPDVRIKFLSHLRKQFDDKGITMFDDNGIERSQIIAPALKTAIGESRIAIVLLSKNYASSSWCLDELLDILKCKEEIGQIVMTVFYEVDPSHVRKQTGDFGKAFNETCAGKTEEQRQKWSQALTYVGNIAGEDFKNWPNEAKMIEKIAQDVSDKLNATPCRDFDGMVGLDDHLRKMESLLDLDNPGVKIVGISGPAGIGKSTISRALYSRLSNRFQHTCFVNNLREVYKIGLGEYDLKLRLHEHLLSKLFNQNGMQIKHLGIIQEWLHDKKVLIILDDVESLDQLDTLANIMWFGAGSRVIVTTANKEVLQQHDIRDIYHVGFPSESEALMIFCISAFGQSSPCYGFTELANEIVRICGNLPLGLRVLGSLLRRKSYSNWIDELPRLKNSLDGRIESVLKLSYESLNEKDGSLFLNIAVFFNYEHVDHVKLMLAAESNLDVRLGLEILANKYLIHIDGSIVVMHHLLQVMAKQVISKQEPWKRQILVDAREISYMLEKASDNGSIVGVSFDVAETKELMVNPKAFKRLRNLLFLKVYNTQWHTRKLHIPEDIEFPRHIRLFHWDAYPGKRLPLRFCAENLVELYMPWCQLEKLWEGKQPLANLKNMDLRWSSCLRKLPDLSNAINLETLDISYCIALVELPSSIANLHKLEWLLITDCESLEVIPSLINLTSLKLFHMEGFTRLRSFPDLPTNITKVYASETTVEELPASLRYCSHLEYVDLCNNGNLKTFLTHLPTSVTFIDLSNCGIERITDCINGLHNLVYLILSSCTRLANLPELPASLRWLSADDCISLESVSGPLNTPNAELHFANCIKLSRQARRTIIQGSFVHGGALLPGRKVPKGFDYQARGNCLKISDSTFNRFKVCLVMSIDINSKDWTRLSVLCRWIVIGNSVKSGDMSFQPIVDPRLSTDHLFIYHISLPLINPSEVSREIVLRFSSKVDDFDIIECGIQILRDETDGSNNRRYRDEEKKKKIWRYDLSDTHESDEASDIEEEDDEDRYTSESFEASNKEEDEDEYKSDFGEASEEKDEVIGDEDDNESVSRKRLRKTSVPTATAFSSQPMVPFTFPDSSAALNAPLPPPTYGFHMLEERTIALTDGSVHSYFALPPNYQDSPPPFHLEEFRDQQNHWDRPEGSMKRKYPHEEEIERAEMLRQSQQFMNYASPNDQSAAGTSNSPFLRDVGEDDRAAKHMRIGPC